MGKLGWKESLIRAARVGQLACLIIVIGGVTLVRANKMSCVESCEAVYIDGEWVNYNCDLQCYYEDTGGTSAPWPDPFPDPLCWDGSSGWWGDCDDLPTLAYTPPQPSTTCRVAGGATCCGGSQRDERDEIRQQQYEFGWGAISSCNAFKYSVPNSSHYTFSDWRSQDRAWTVALLDEATVGNFWCVISNWGFSAPTLNSGYRTPAHNDSQQQSPGTGQGLGSWHTKGYAADLDTPNGPAGQADWDLLRHHAKIGACDVACVEPRSLTPYHFHGDHRIGSCPSGW